MKKLALFIVPAIIFLSGYVLVSAGETAKAKSNGEQAEFSGKVVCVSCTLKKSEGARAECSTYGHQHALKTADGKFINFLVNRYSADLISGEKYHNKDVKVHGVYYANANQLDVETIKSDGKTVGWCGHCSKMDGCAYKKDGM